MLEGLQAFLPEGAAVDFLIHGTTVGLNSVLERKGARVALVTTRNFGDVYAIQGNDRRDIFSIHYRKPKGLIERRDVFVVTERLRADGSVETPIELADLDPLIAAVKAGRYDAVAVCFLHAYRNPCTRSPSANTSPRRCPRRRSRCRTTSRRSGASSPAPRPPSWRPISRR